VAFAYAEDMVLQVGAGCSYDKLAAMKLDSQKMNAHPT
jgi:hypothetical protein